MGMIEGAPAEIIAANDESLFTVRVLDGGGYEVECVAHTAKCDHQAITNLLFEALREHEEEVGGFAPDGAA
jgi:hypothetical protein